MRYARHEEWTFDFETMTYKGDYWICCNSFRYNNGVMEALEGYVHQIHNSMNSTLSMKFPQTWETFNDGNEEFNSKLLNSYNLYIDNVFEELLTGENKSS